MTLAPARLRAMQQAVLDWYGANARDLAFRRRTDPWSVLVSEVIAQQTQASRAAAGWSTFIARFPTPAALAAASPAEALRAWRGLGYNRRAVALRRAALAIVEEHDGRVPATFDELIRLPGIGPYTARAVLAIAFNQPVAALDTNIRRVLGRAFTGADNMAGRAAFQASADGFVPPGRAATWTHALMDVGAAFCSKRNPRCPGCPLLPWCGYPITGRPAATPSPRSRSQPFRSTTRWLRGRIVDLLRDAPDDGWLSFAEPIGDHPSSNVRRQLEVLASEGLIELEDAGLRARLRTDA